MAEAVFAFSATVPAGTPRAQPQVTKLAMPSRTVRRVEVVIPPGPRGEVGFMFTSGGVQMIPENPGAFFVTDNEKIGWDLEAQIDSGAWELSAYNTGALDHTLYVRFLTDPVRPAAASASAILAATGFPAPIDPSLISGG